MERLNLLQRGPGGRLEEGEEGDEQKVDSRYVDLGGGGMLCSHDSQEVEQRETILLRGSTHQGFVKPEEESFIIMRHRKGCTKVLSSVGTEVVLVHTCET